MKIKSLLNYLNEEESSLTVAIIRIGLIPLIWSAWAYDLRYIGTYTKPIWTITGAIFFISSTAVFFGYYTKYFKWIFAACMLFIYYGLGWHYGTEPYTHHHRYILVFCSVILALSNSEGSLSVDAYLAKANYKSSFKYTNTRWLRLLFCLQITSMYLWAAYDKCSYAFLSGQRMEHVFMYIYLGSDFPESLFFLFLTKFIAIFTVIYEIFLPIALWIPKFRGFAIVTGIIFHGVIYYTLPVGTYTLTMWLLYLGFLSVGMAEGMIKKSF